MGIAPAVHVEGRIAAENILHIVLLPTHSGSLASSRSLPLLWMMGFCTRIVCYHIYYSFIFGIENNMVTDMDAGRYYAADDRYDNGMKYRRCGKSGIMLPELSLGMWHNFGSADRFDNMRSIAHYAFDHGITHFDLADNYGPVPGSAEENFGRLMKSSFAPYRDELFVSTKAGHDMWPGPYGTWNSRKHLIAGLDQSLKRMNLEYVDLFYSHRYDPQTPIEETLHALIDIVHSGKALYVGLSKYPKEQAIFAYGYLESNGVHCLTYQGRYNMLATEVDESGIIDDAAARDVGFVAFSPLAQGLLTDKYLNGIPEDSRVARGGFLKREQLTEGLLDVVARLNKVALDRGESLADMALAWILADSNITSVIVGASSVDQLGDNLQCLYSAPFSDEEINEIDSILKMLKQY